jgi:hypothetical protein
MTCTAIPPYVQCRCPHCQFGKLRGIASGVIYPKGQNAARDEAQVREFERALAEEVAA